MEVFLFRIVMYIHVKRKRYIRSIYQLLIGWRQIWMQACSRYF